jgi:hypothetical protein
LLASIAARASEGLGRGRAAVPATDCLPDRPSIARLWSLASGELALLAVPAARPRFPFSIVFVLGSDVAATRLVFSLVDLRPGKREHSRHCEADAGDLVIACARERWVRVGGVLGLQPVRRRLETSGTTLEVLELAF